MTATLAASSAETLEDRVGAVEAAGVEYLPEDARDSGPLPREQTLAPAKSQVAADFCGFSPREIRPVAALCRGGCR